MKRILLAALLLTVAAFTATAQTDLAPDQNPNYKISLQKYTQIKDSLQSNMNTTVQQTYKAYDWYEAKMERKQQRREARYERRRLNAMYGYNNFGYYNNWGYNGWNNGYYNNWNNWNNRGWGNNNWNWFWNNRPSIGYRSGNWWFWF